MSAKRKKRAPKSGAVWHMSADEATLAKKPRYNGYACGHGTHGDAKYSRTKSKRAWQKQLKQEGAPRGSFLFTFCLHSGCRKQRAHEPERGHTASETDAVSKGRHPICPEHEEGMQNATCTCGRKRPARRANANIKTYPSDLGFRVFISQFIPSGLFFRHTRLRSPRRAARSTGADNGSPSRPAACAP